ncbi:MAG: hypothetical protein KKD39_06800 [Candidatus Altiarchaeota archaeon]|nr:hypothetical protein [Candidatus Altiarchaeota archaeon]
MEYVELFTGEKVPKEALELGWSSVCVAVDFPGKRTVAETLQAAVVKSDIEKNTKKAVETFDLVFVEASKEDDARKASELWNVDILYNNELNEARDLIYNKSSGLDNVICTFMAERNIGYLINASNVLDSGGSSRVKLLGRLRQNVLLCRKYGVKVVLSNCAKDRQGLRNPLDLAAIGSLFGMTSGESVDAVSKNPLFFIQKGLRRRDPNVLTDGLVVKEWGSQKHQGKKRQGWL